VPLPSATSWGRGSHQNALRRPFTFHARVHRPKQIARCWYRSTALRRLRSHKGRELFPQMTGLNCSLNCCFAVRETKKGGGMAFGSLMQLLDIEGVPIVKCQIWLRDGVVPTGTLSGSNQVPLSWSCKFYFIGAKLPYWWDGGIPIEG